MAELAKKLHLKKGTTEHIAKAYSTTVEAGTEYITNKIDGVIAYVPIGATNDSRATMGRIKKSGGIEKAILTMGKPPYTEKSWTSPGTYTFTVPQGVTRIKVTCVGGGGGGIARVSNLQYTQTGGNGGKSYFGNIEASGGSGCSVTATYKDMDDWGYSIFTVNQYPYGGSPNGNNGQLAKYNGLYGDKINNNYPVKEVGKATWVNGGAGFALSTTKSVGNYGRGGNVYNWDYIGNLFGSGGSGGWQQGFVNVTAGQTISLGVGNRGAYGGADAGGVNSAASAQATSGFVIIEYGGNI